VKDNPKHSQFSAEELSQDFDKQVSVADVRRAEALEGLQTMRSAKTSSLKREQARLSLKLGNEHVRVQQMARAVAENERFASNLAVEIVRAKTVIPVVNKNSWAMHGYVRNEDLQGQPDLTVALYDPTGHRVEPLGYACTDRFGYFELHYPDASDLAAGRPKSVTAEVSPRISFVIRVSNRRQEILHEDKPAVTVQLGQVEYREIILGARGFCTPPAGEPSRAPKSGTTGSAAPAVSASHRRGRKRTSPSKQRN
jgi:hypothetical protein